MLARLFAFIQRMERITLYRAMHGGLIMLIPVLLTGAFALALQSLPIPSYIAFINSFLTGALFGFLNVVYSATFRLLSVYTTIFIGLSYGREESASRRTDFGNVASALICFFILIGSTTQSFTFDSLGAKGMFIALLSSLLSSAIYWRLKRRIRIRTRLYSDGMDAKFNDAVHVLPPLVITVALFALADAVVCDLCSVKCIYQLFINAANALFSIPMTDAFRALLYIIISSCLWFFGIHGSDCLEGVAEQYFIPANAANVSAAAAGLPVENIFTKGFFDVFVLMGGCGTSICLLCALLLFSRRRSNRILTKMAILPMIFNINEVMLFGLPVILNPIMLIPFLTAPLIAFAVSYFAMSSGLVPLVSADIGWTTPILLGGYMATGSFAGLALQLVNFILGTAIYAPFVRLLDRQHAYAARDNYKELVDILRINESKGQSTSLSMLEGSCGIVAKSIASDIGDAIEKKDFEMYYQPQYSYSGSCIGVEALLRWRHPSYGIVYPPLAIKLAEESGNLLKLDMAVIDKVLDDSEKIQARFGRGVKISVNVTGGTIVQPQYCTHMQALFESGAADDTNLCLEVTEQTAISFDTAASEIFSKIKQLGVSFAIDDFSMGQTSIDYLKDNTFSLIKLDGSLTRGILDNGNCFEIVSSISKLADSLGIDILAEYVETKEQMQRLHEAGCDMYQGYLYSPAVKL